MGQSPLENKGKPRWKSPNWDVSKRVAAFLNDPLDEPDAHDLPTVTGYHLQAKLGTGASGSVYSAIPADSSKTAVAIKLFTHDLSDAKPSARVLRELELLSELRSPFVPRIHDYGTDHGRFFIATDVVDGVNLNQFCETNALDLRQRVKLIVKIARAAQALHEVGVIHRDLKPSNIMITHDGQPMLIDLGVAMLLNATTGQTITADGSPVGSLGYMSPEQARGERGGTTIRSDVFALGATACFTLTGKTPHDPTGPVHEAVRRAGQDLPLHPSKLDPSLPKALAAILHKATARQAHDRFSSAAEFADYLERWLDGQPIDIASPSFVHRLRYHAGRNPWLTATSTAACFAAIAAIYFGTVALGESRLASEQSRLADEKSALAEERRLAAEEREEYAQRVETQMRELMVIVRRWVEEARNLADQGSFGEALFTIRGLDRLIADTGMDQELAEANIAQRKPILLDAIRALYSVDELEDNSAMQAVEAAIDQLEAMR